MLCGDAFEWADLGPSRPMTASPTATVTLAADARNVSRARRVLQDAMVGGGRDDDVDAALVALSELVTNAFVHAGTEAKVVVWSTSAGTRVEVEDGGAHLPVRRNFADTAATGRGLQLVEELTDRWGVERRGGGKVVWFELGQAVVPASLESGEAADDTEAGALYAVTLREVPLLMHWAWQEHAAALLREYLLHVLEEDFTVLDRHAEASQAMALLHEALPAPDLPDDPDELMAGSLEPHVTADEVILHVPDEAVAHFATLDDLLRAAVREARAGRFLGPPTQPEIEEMRSWICSEVRQQAGGDAVATPWLARTDVRATLADQAELAATYGDLAAVDEPLLATDEASIIVATSPAALALLGYARAEDLLGRRVIAVVPDRYRQAHIAGTTLHATNGRDNLLEVSLVVPMIRADGTELPVSIEVRPERLVAPDGGERRVFVARFRSA